MYDGILLINKSAGMSSYDVIRRLKPLLPPKSKIGHAGTLDPFATGLLIITLGKATKLFDRFQELKKSYKVVGEFGYETDTYDITGQKVAHEENGLEHINAEDIEEVLEDFRGEILQIPPKFSAKRVGGKRAYDLARNKKDFKLDSKKVHIYTLKLMNYERPFMKLFIECSKGTYIRSLVVDIARQMETFATAIELERVGIGEYTLDDAVELRNVDIERNLIKIDDIKL